MSRPLLPRDRAAHPPVLPPSVEQGRPTEIDFVNGAIVARARRHGIAVPVNATLVAAMRGLERAA